MEQTKGRAYKNSDSNPSSTNPNKTQTGIRFMLMLNNGICKYGKETKDPTGRNVAIFDFRFRENIFFLGKRAGKGGKTTSNLLANYNRSAHTHTLARILVCMHISYRMSLPNRKSTCVRLKCFCTYFYCECLSNFPAFTSSFPFALFFWHNLFKVFFSLVRIFKREKLTL